MTTSFCRTLYSFFQTNSNPILVISTFIMSIGTLALAMCTYWLWKETREQHKTIQKSKLIPIRISNIIDPTHSLFTGNFEYPISDPIEHNTLFFLGIKNIGLGAAFYAKVVRFKSSNGDEIFARPGFVHIQPGQTIPLVIRFGYNEPMDLTHVTQQVLIQYFDNLGKSYYLNLDLWLRNVKDKKIADAIVVRFSEKSNYFENIGYPIFRYLELKGYFEIEHISGKLNNENDKTI